MVLAASSEVAVRNVVALITPEAIGVPQRMQGQERSKLRCGDANRGKMTPVSSVEEMGVASQPIGKFPINREHCQGVRCPVCRSDVRASWV